MATAEEIELRVEQVDTARSAKRSAAAQQVGALAERRAAIAEQLAGIEEQLGDILAAAQEVMDMDELAAFTDVPAADLTRWLAARKPSRSKRKRPAAGTASDTSHGPSATRTATARPASTPPEPTPARTDADAPVRVPAEVA
jgi:hypothetical protein